MPLGKYKDFAACILAQKAKGMSDEEANRYCGFIQSRIEGTKAKHQQYEFPEDEDE
jgi:hypothetical protein